MEQQPTEAQGSPVVQPSIQSIPAGGLDGIMNELIWRWGAEKVKQMNILNQNGANMVYVHNQDIAQKLGLSDNVRSAITPFPASNTLIITQPPPPPPPPVQPKPEEPKPEKPKPKEPVAVEPKPTVRPKPNPAPVVANGVIDKIKKYLLPLVIAAVAGAGTSYLMGPSDTIVDPVDVTVEDPSGNLGITVE